MSAPPPGARGPSAAPASKGTKGSVLGRLAAHPLPPVAALAFNSSLFFPLMAVAVATFPPTLIVPARLLIGALCLVLWLRVRGLALPPLGHAAWRTMLLAGALGNVIPFLLFAWAMGRMESGVAAVLAGAMPLWTALLAGLLLRERFSPVRVVGLAVGFAGIALLSIPRGADRLESWLEPTALVPKLAIVLATLCYALTSLYIQRRAIAAPETNSTGTLLSGGLLATPLLLLDLGWLAGPVPANAIAAVLILGVVSSGLGTFLYFFVTRAVGATRMALSNYLTSGFALLWGWLLFDEPLSAQKLVALALIVAGVALAARR